MSSPTSGGEKIALDMSRLFAVVFAGRRVVVDHVALPLHWVADRSWDITRDTTFAGDTAQLVP
jgi:hypothetical protein